jgi:hypothetical protein
MNSYALNTEMIFECYTYLYCSCPLSVVWLSCVILGDRVYLHCPNVGLCTQRINGKIQNCC